MALSTQLNRLAAALLASTLALGAAAAQESGENSGAAPTAGTGAVPAAPAGDDAPMDDGEGEDADDGMAGAADEETEDAPTAADEQAQPEDGGEDRRAARTEKAADVEAQYADLRTRFETALAAGDADGIGALFMRRSLVTPLTGDTLEGVQEIEDFYRDSPKPESVEIRSQQMDRFGRMVLDNGTLSLKMPASAGGGTVASEYVMLARMTRDGMRILRLMLFPARQAAAAPAQ